MTESLLDLTDQEIISVSRLFGLLGDPTRVRILLLLCKGELNVTRLCATLGLPQPTVSHHLGLLRMNNLIGNRRDGKQVYYGINGRFQTPGDNALHFAVENYTIQIGNRAAEATA